MTIKVDFLADIKPILDSSCLRCHNPEKAKSSYRLDNRAAALKGGEHGVDILPGNSAKSPLIHYCAGLVEDMEMPPSGKGPRLTPTQLGVLRAWIDQGVVWDNSASSNSLEFTISPTVGVTGVSGDARKFRELYWQREGANGGLEEFDMFQLLGADDRVRITGHALRDDYKIDLRADRAEFGFIHAGWEQYRKYYDDIGGFYKPFKPPAFTLERDLHLDNGKAWIDFGLTLPHWPRMVLGYEYDYKQGAESTTDWGSVQQGAVERNILPASKAIHENTHTIKFDLDHEIGGVTIEDRFRGEFYSLNTARTNFSPSTLSGGAPAPLGYQAENVSEGTRYFQGANTFRLERQFTDWFLASGGYLYSKLNADSTFNRQTFPLAGAPVASLQLLVPQIELERESHVVNLNGLFGPFDGLTISSGVQSEWTRQTGIGAGAFDAIAPKTVFDPATLGSSYDEALVEETMALRYTKIPYTVLFAEGRFEQEAIGQSGGFALNNPLDPNNLDNLDFSQHTDYSKDTSDLRVGFNTSPLQSVSFSAHYRYQDDDSHFHNGQLRQSSFVSAGYPGFFNMQDLLTHEVEAKLVLHPGAYFKTTLSYQYRVTDTHTEAMTLIGNSLGNNLLTGQENSQTYSINTIVYPTRRLYLSTTFSYQPTTVVTATGTATSEVPYRGSVYTVMSDGTFALNDTTDLFAAYSFSMADYGQNNITTGLPLGIQYQQHSLQAGVTRRLGKNLTTTLQYRFNYYNEPSSGGISDFTAHGIFATVTYKFR